MLTTYDENLFSDLHKEAYGVRPSSSHSFYATQDKSEKELIWTSTLTDANEAVLAETEAMTKNQIEFEKEIQTQIENGMERDEAVIAVFKDRNIDFIIESNPGYLCYLIGIPYSYEKEFGDILNGNI